MARKPDERLSSQQLAAFNQTNPVVVRRTLGLLREQGIVSSERGHAGGWQLSQDPAEITLAAVYDALGERFLRPDPVGEDNPPHCAIERKIGSTLSDALSEAEQVLVRRLREVTIAAIAAEMT